MIANVMNSHRAMPSWENVRQLAPEGARLVAGVDEVGRGVWAGPVTAAAVILPPGLELPGVTDSKQMSAKNRLAADRLIRSAALAIGIGWASAEEVDGRGLSAAIALAGRRALAELQPQPEFVLLDGTWNYIDDYPAATLPKGDALLPSVAAASVIAKVARDRYMALQDRRYPGYTFGRHAGYGTAAHRAAIGQYGLTPLHRRSVKRAGAA